MKWIDFKFRPSTKVPDSMPSPGDGKNLRPRKYGLLKHESLLAPDAPLTGGWRGLPECGKAYAYCRHMLLQVLMLFLAIVDDCWIGNINCVVVGVSGVVDAVLKLVFATQCWRIVVFTQLTPLFP
ncbi:hypothetical protein Nepgr_008062 [Nepenthes gracilis]|uniref:Uncharacterized protein n=1 Tax=Nepenthes gracilis TaxID=150966 RepID=A0AAD3XIV3_NEPGR|nr:hypothetical protein Nepgr_008062 [Nepenthes gracilis]